MDPSNIFIKPEELHDARLLYWATHHARRYIAAQQRLDRAQTHHEAFMAEVIQRGLLSELMEKLNG